MRATVLLALLALFVIVSSSPICDLYTNKEPQKVEGFQSSLSSLILSLTFLTFPFTVPPSSTSYDELIANQYLFSGQGSHMPAFPVISMTGAACASIVTFSDGLFALESHPLVFALYLLWKSRCLIFLFLLSFFLFPQRAKLLGFSEILVCLYSSLDLLGCFSSQLGRSTQDSSLTTPARALSPMFPFPESPMWIG
jgi:hypothetical protein